VHATSFLGYLSHEHSLRNPAMVLVAIDLKPQSRIILFRAIELAAARSARLTVLHVVENDMFNISSDIANENDVRGYLFAKVRAKVEKLIQACHRQHVQLHVRIEIGSPPMMVMKVATEICARLIIIGPSNRKSFKGRIIGSTTDRVIRASPRSVLIVKRASQEQYRRIIAAIDFSSLSEAVITETIDLFRDAQLQLVNVTNIPAQFEQALIRIGAGRAKIEQYRNARIADARNRLSMLARPYVRRGRAPEFKLKVLKGDPSNVLVRLSGRRNVDLIAIGPHGHGLALQALLGSVAQTLLRKAACDILVAREFRRSN
jgi:nucleotide-binding universal stress UspA family protein